MFIYIYTAPIPLLFSLFLLAICIWSSLTHKVATTSNTLKNGWRITNYFIAILAVFVIFNFTLFSRFETHQEVHLLPFRLLLIAKDNPEMYRSMFMNVILFVPLGMSVSSVFSQKSTLKKRVIFTCIFGLLLSITVETSQYVFSLGTTEFDDLACNTFGAFIGTSPLLIQKIYEKYEPK